VSAADISTSVAILRSESEEAFASLVEALDGVTEGETWALAARHGAGVLHSDGSILGIVQHVAVCKVMYASAAFRGTEVRWRECVTRLRESGSSWDANLTYLREAQEYWLESWSGLADEDLATPRMTNWGERWACRRIITTVAHHDSYHAGQISLLRAIVEPVAAAPPPFANSFAEHLIDSPSW
jgi:hypothetical protein